MAKLLHQQRHRPANLALSGFISPDGAKIRNPETRCKLALGKTSPQANGFELGCGHLSGQAFTLRAQGKSGEVQRVIGEKPNATLLEVVRLNVGRVLILGREYAMKVIDGVPGIDRHALLPSADHAERRVGHASPVGAIRNSIFVELNHVHSPSSGGAMPRSTAPSAQECGIQSIGNSIGHIVIDPSASCIGASVVVSSGHDCTAQRSAAAIANA